MEVVVLGLGVTGDAVVRHLRAAGEAVTVLEDAPRHADDYRDRVERARAAGAVVQEAPTPATVAAAVHAADLLVPSPGVPARHPAVTAARGAGIPVRAEIDLAAERLSSRRLVAITGTNGKTTVTTLTTEMLAASAVRTVAAGNIGTPLLDVVEADVNVVVAEVSSFQLVFTTAAFRPGVAVLLNVAPDHLDWHDSFADYAAAKARVFAHQRNDDVVVYNADDSSVARLVASAPARRVPFSGARGERANQLAASAAALEAGATQAGVAAALARFEGLPHRLRLIAEIAGVRYYDDSKATNPHATLHAVDAAPGPVVLLAGGRNKGLDLSVLTGARPRLRAVVAIGEAAGEVEAAFAGTVPVTRASSMRDAVAAAVRHARRGDVVLLSPGCASFDWYHDYAARGDDFAREVDRLGAPARSGGGR